MGKRQFFFNDECRFCLQENSSQNKLEYHQVWYSHIHFRKLGSVWNKEMLAIWICCGQHTCHMSHKGLGWRKWPLVKNQLFTTAQQKMPVSVSLLLSLLHFLIGVGSSTEFTVGWLKFTAFLQYKPVNIKFESNIFAFGALDNLKIWARFCWDIKDLGKIKKSLPEMLLESCSRPSKSRHSP